MNTSISLYQFQLFPNNPLFRGRRIISGVRKLLHRQAQPIISLQNSGIDRRNHIFQQRRKQAAYIAGMTSLTLNRFQLFTCIIVIIVVTIIIIIINFL